ncbi:MAG: hypothetical protein JWQ81_859 [Amycolatopsis sp.]|uniref:hypothetical protein n=1 Tax=Amycolatopsis sp. TaxID=37632 RepID=UPI00260B9A88|nr:hypothetical protein [Amycolatopsis sp.]MCU1680120.1 hypothetical protein [Amycolatopsis sp.]
MTGAVPVPVDIAELVVRRLRPLLAGRSETVAAGVKVSTETGFGTDGGPPSLPWLLIVEDGHIWTWPAVQSAVIRLTCWHRDIHTAKRLAGIALGLLCAPMPAGTLFSGEPIAAPVEGIDPYTAAPLATASLTVYTRTPTQS